MGQFTVSRTMKHSIEDVWAALEDFGGVHRYSGGVESSPINSGTPERGVGSERNCQLYDGNYIQERVTESVEKKHLGIEVFDTSMPIKSATAAFDITTTSDGGTKVDMTMEYVVKFGIVGKAMDAMMLKGAMTKSLTNLLAGLDEHLTTGALIEKGWQPAKAA